MENQGGITLLEVVVSMILFMMILGSMVTVFSHSLFLWSAEKDAITREETARIAVDTIMREIRYAQHINLPHSGALEITKLDGETITFQLGSGAHANTLYMRIHKADASAGDGSTNPITENIVTSLVFTPYPEPEHVQAIGITLEVMDQQHQKKYTIQTAGYPWNSDKTLLY